MFFWLFRKHWTWYLKTKTLENRRVQFTPNACNNWNYVTRQPIKHKSCLYSALSGRGYQLEVVRKLISSTWSTYRVFGDGTVIMVFGKQREGRRNHHVRYRLWSRNKQLTGLHMLRPADSLTLLTCHDWNVRHVVLLGKTDFVYKQAILIKYRLFIYRVFIKTVPKLQELIPYIKIKKNVPINKCPETLTCYPPV